MSPLLGGLADKAGKVNVVGIARMDGEGNEGRLRELLRRLELDSLIGLRRYSWPRREKWWRC